MTATTRSFGKDIRVIGLVASAHFLSHFYIFLLPPLFPILKDAFGVGYVALGLLMTVFNIASGITHIPMGFMVDRFGAHRLLIGGIVLQASVFALIGILGTYEWMLALIVISGIANSVYHPSDYAILSASVDGERMGRAYSLHTFAGFFGGAMAPGVTIALATFWNWQAAMFAAAVFGYAIAILLLLNHERLTERSAATPASQQHGAAGKPAKTGMSLLLSPPIVMCFLFFVMLAMSSGGINAFAVAALVMLYDLSLPAAATALTGFLVGSSLGILAGGVIADRTNRHERVAMFGFGTTAIIIAVIGSIAMPAPLIIALFTLGGLLYGLIMPSRDMLVRAVTPDGAMGTVFGFVSTGLNVGAAITPALFGWILDQGDPRWLFWLAAGSMVLALGTVVAAKATR